MGFCPHIHVCGADSRCTRSFTSYPRSAPACLDCPFAPTLAHNIQSLFSSAATITSSAPEGNVSHPRARYLATVWQASDFSRTIRIQQLLTLQQAVGGAAIICDPAQEGIASVEPPISLCVFNMADSNDVLKGTDIIVKDQYIQEKSKADHTKDRSAKRTRPILQTVQNEGSKTGWSPGRLHPFTHPRRRHDGGVAQGHKGVQANDDVQMTAKLQAAGVVQATMLRRARQRVQQQCRFSRARRGPTSCAELKASERGQLARVAGISPSDLGLGTVTGRLTESERFFISTQILQYQRVNGYMVQSLCYELETLRD